MPSITHKVCKGCLLDKPVKEFYQDGTKKDGYHTRCKKCKKIAHATAVQKRHDREAVEKELMENEEILDTVPARANRAALLALVDNHRSEFDSLVKREVRKLKAAATDSEVPDWMLQAREKTSVST